LRRERKKNGKYASAKYFEKNILETEEFKKEIKRKDFLGIEPRASGP